MTTLSLIVWIIGAVCLLLHASIRLERTRHSWFELKRLDDQQTMRRERLLDDLIALRQFVAVVLIIIMTPIAVSLWGLLGIVIMILILLVSMLTSRLKIVQQFALKIYQPWEPRLLDFLERFPITGLIFANDRHPPKDKKLESVAQLAHLVTSSGHVLTPDQQDIIINGLDWNTTKIEAVMTPQSRMVTVKHNELLGPLVLDDLHKSGHSRFPVTKGAINNVIGILDITALLEVSAVKRSETAERAMSPQILRIEADETLPAALTMLEKSHQHLLLVVDEEGNTLGLVTLSDITGFLLGHPDSH